jgi:acetyltransferase
MTLSQVVTEYPKTIALRDGRQVEIRPLEAADKERLLAFFQRIPEDERFYLKEDVTSASVIQQWTSDIDWDRIVPLVAIRSGQIVADATLHRSRSPSRRSIGEFRIVVAPDHREQGLGTRLLRELIDVGLALKLERVTMQVVAEHEQAAITAAERIGFQVVAQLEGWVCDRHGQPQTLVLLDLPLDHYTAWWRY